MSFWKGINPLSVFCLSQKDSRLGVWFLSLIFFPLSRLPLAWLYRLSDGLFYLLFYLFLYRRKVVSANLRNSFPGRDEVWLKQTEKQFYRNLCDLIVETIKGFTISEMELRTRCHIENPELLEDLLRKKKNIVLLAGHTGNWEFGALISCLSFKATFYGMYQPVSAKAMDHLFRQTRSRLGLNLISASKGAWLLRSAHLLPSPRVIMFMADQTPVQVNRSYWMDFLNQKTPVYTGPEKIARAGNDAVIFCEILRKHRGHYRFRFKLITENAAQTEPNEISEKGMKLLEDFICRQPDNWLWSHKRWKRAHLFPGA